VDEMTGLDSLIWLTVLVVAIIIAHIFEDIKRDRADPGGYKMDNQEPPDSDLIFEDKDAPTGGAIVWLVGIIATLVVVGIGALLC
jgi:hypothetical protein